MGLCFNNDIYDHLSKGLIHPDLLEMISNSNVLAGSVIVAPSMYIKHIWEQDADFKFYYNQIFSGLHDTILKEENISADLKSFYDVNGIDYQAFSKL